MKRDFVYKGINFHLNDNGFPNSPRREFEGKYKLLFWHNGYERWQSVGNVNTKKEAQERARQLYKERYFA